jgi:myo-inositol catabolism protein IolS
VSLIPVKSNNTNHLNIYFGGAAVSGEGAGYGFGDISDTEAQKLLEHSFEAGFRVYDSAPIYGFGLSEQRLGRCFNSKREEVYLVSKSGVSWHDTKRVNMTNDPLVTQKMLDQSLRDFNTDYIDLYMIHWPDANVDIRHPYEVLLRAKELGKIREIGLCNTNISDFNKAHEMTAPDVVQAQYNMFNSECFAELPESIRKMGWGSFDKGILTGRVDAKREFDSSDCRSWAPWWKKSPLKSKFKKIDRVKKYLESTDVSLLDLAIHFSLSNKINLSPIIGMRSTEQIDSVIESTKVSVTSNIISDCYNLIHEC